MPLHKISDVDPNYRFSDHDIMGFNIYSGDEVIGSVDDILVDDQGKFRYIVLFIGRFLTGKRVLLPFGVTRLSNSDRSLYTEGFSTEQVERLPEYDPKKPIDYDHEEQVRNIYRPANSAAGTTAAVGTETFADVNAEPAAVDSSVAPVAADRDRYDYSRDPALYDLNDQSHNQLKLYEERLVADKVRQKTGEVAIGKRVETETAQVSVPLEKERVVIESVTPTDADTPVTPGEEAFHEGEVARMEVHEETPDIKKEAFVREEVAVRKEVDRDVVEAEEEVRREQLDVDTTGQPLVDNQSNPLHDK